MNIRIILNGKKAGLDSVRESIFSARQNGAVEVRVTWEGGDVDRLVNEAVNDGCQRIVIGGGDGSVNEVVNALMQFDIASRPELAVLPLGTANDFATACTIPGDLAEALTLAQTGQAQYVDCAKANEYYFMNIASGGFGAQVTSTTPVALKNFLGGGAYTLQGLVQALNFVPYTGQVRFPDEEVGSSLIAGAVCNGSQAGGGQQLAPDAMLDDGLLDVVGLNHFEPEMVGEVINELLGLSDSNHHVIRKRVPWVEWQSENMMPINLDGEPISESAVRFEIVPREIKLVLPSFCPLITGMSNV